ncbi:hypothetical protein [Sorangium atrum]|uniref:Secreted protein n=1 Tax=Sorangium atrum TaxID=2995308 RepID=A0ABT5C1R0_9BACT|nr:hypothetical protein [Sorangium aterium]MDC0680355.1 hypothetical protein [Sorangium aterium]
MKSSSSKPRHRGANEATKPRRQSSKRPAGKPGPASPGKATSEPSKYARGASPADRATVHGTINEALRQLIKRIARRPWADFATQGPAWLALLVLDALVLVLERRGADANPEDMIMWLEKPNAVFSMFGGQPVTPARSAPPAPATAPPSPPSPPARKDVRDPADPHLRTLGIEFHACADELGKASIADMMSLLFVGDDDPTLAIQDGIRREVNLIRYALQSEEDVDTEAVGMALWQIEARLIVARELYCRMRESIKDERAQSEGGRS